jgi:hypothetical protein
MPALGGDVVDPAAGEPGVRLAVGVADHVPAPAGEPAEHADLGRSGSGLHEGSDLGVAQACLARHEGQPEDRPPVGHEVERAEGQEAHVHADDDRHGERDHASSGLAAAVHCLELIAVAGRLVRIDREHVPVEGPLAGAGELDHELHVVVAEAVEAAVGGVFEAGALVARHLARQREELGAGRPPRGDGLTVAVGVCAGEGGREAEAAGLDRRAQQRDHLVELCVGRLIAHRSGPHHAAADRAVAHEEAGVHAEVAVEAGQVLGEGIPLAVDSGLEGRQRHALDPGHHAPRVVAVARRQRSEGEAAVAGDDGGDPVQVRRRCRRVPQDLRVVVGVRIDEPGAHHVAAGVDDLGRLG